MFFIEYCSIVGLDFPFEYRLLALMFLLSWWYCQIEASICRIAGSEFPFDLVLLDWIPIDLIQYCEVVVLVWGGCNKLLFCPNKVILSSSRYSSPV